MDNVSSTTKTSINHSDLKLIQPSLELTILMPCLNEAETLATCINKAKDFLKREKISGEVLIADNGSIDGSQGIAVEHGARVVHVPTKGYGAALMQGIEEAAGKYVIMGDADDSYNFQELIPFLHKLRKGYDLVMGSRFKGKIEPGAMPFLNKYLGNPILSFLGRVFFKSKISDFHCGLRGFRRDAIQKLDLQTQGMEFASEMIAKAILQKLTITEVPTTLSPDGRSRKPHLRPWRDGWRHLRLLLMLSPQWLFFYPGSLLLIVGLSLMGLLSLNPVKINNLTLDIHTMLFASLFIIVGLQAICFFVFARIIAISKWQIYPKKETFLHFFTLEKGLVLGVTLSLLGCVGAAYSFFIWMNSGFGALMPTQMMRVLIPSFTFLIAGMQLFFASFFMGLLGLRYKREKDPFDNTSLS